MHIKAHIGQHLAPAEFGKVDNKRARHDLRAELFDQFDPCNCGAT